jgi:light-harvesting complex 1 beta chain
MTDDRSCALSDPRQTGDREWHGMFVTGFVAFSVVAIIAHIFAWNWRPWL